MLDAQGRSRKMRAVEVMNSFIVRARTTNTVWEVACAMRDHGVGIVCVCDDDQSPIGVVTDRDLVVRVCSKNSLPEKVLIKEVMTPKLISCPLDASVEDIHRLMKEHGVARVLVTDGNGCVAGVVTLAELWHYESPLEAAPISRRVTERELRVHGASSGATVDESRPSRRPTPYAG